jgi:hypothetical protein
MNRRSNAPKRKATLGSVAKATESPEQANRRWQEEWQAERARIRANPEYELQQQVYRRLQEARLDRRMHRNRWQSILIRLEDIVLAYVPGESDPEELDQAVLFLLQANALCDDGDWKAGFEQMCEQSFGPDDLVPVTRWEDVPDDPHALHPTEPGPYRVWLDAKGHPIFREPIDIVPRGAVRIQQHRTEAQAHLLGTAERQLEKVNKLAQHGGKFASKGRGRGPIRKAIDQLLQKNPRAKNDELWTALAARPPRGWKVVESREFGKYVEGPTTADDIQYSRFRNICSEARKKVK